MVQTIEEIQKDIIADFSLFEDWADKYEYIIEMGKSLPELNAIYKVDVNLIQGCQSKVWLHAEMKDDVLVFEADSDAFITKGIIALLVKVLSNHAPMDIMEADLFFLKEIGLQEHLSPTRANGLVAMVKQMKAYALAFYSKIKVTDGIG